MHGLVHTSKDDEGNTNWGAWAAKELLANGTGGNPIVRDIAAHFLDGRDYSVTPEAALVTSTGQTGYDAMLVLAGQPLSTKRVKHAATTAGYAFGLRLGQAGATGTFLWVVADGDAHP